MHCWLNWIFLTCIIKFQNPWVKTNQFPNQSLPIITLASHVALMWPVTSELWPTLVLVNAHCDPEARASVLIQTINHHYPSVRLTTDDCACVYRTLEMFAAHLLGHSIPKSMLKTLSCLVIAPLLNTCHKCSETLTVIARRQVLVYDHRSGPTPGDLLTAQCGRCRDRFERCWRFAFSHSQPGDVRKTGALKGGRSCIGLPTSYISTRQGIICSCRFLNHASHAILYSHSLLVWRKLSIMIMLVRSYRPPNCLRHG